MKSNMSRKRERQFYWMVIAALSIISLSMIRTQLYVTNLEHGSGYIAFNYSENEPTEETVIENKIPEYEEGEIDENCQLYDNYYGESNEDEDYDYGQSEEKEYYASEDENEDNESGDHRRRLGSGDEDKKQKKPKHKQTKVLGTCSYIYPSNTEPAEGFLGGIDFYHLRSTIKNLENCFLKCIDMTEKKEIESSWLVQAASMGLTKVSLKLMTQFGYDPAFISIPQEGQPEEFNAVQAAIRGGHVLTVKALTKSNNAMIIDRHDRTVADYIHLNGSPIRPTEAKKILGLIVRHDKSIAKENRDKNAVKDENKSGWSTKTLHKYDNKCDIDVLHHEMHRDEFFKDYYSTGRPFVLRGHVPKEEVAAFSKERWNTKRKYNTHKRGWKVGPTAYPSLTNQESCSREYTITEIENCTKCPEMPDTPMVTAWHPSDEDFDILYPGYSNDNEFYKSSGWRKIEEWFGSAKESEKELSWQVFLGGDDSGATLHWHAAALNMLYVGTKEWRLTPPSYKGWTGMPARKAAKILEESFDDIVLKCTQQAGDLIYVPESWGHLTLNRGFTIGAAVILAQNYHTFNNIPTPTEEEKSTAVAVHQPKNIPFMFVHINKAGGSSIISMLRSRCTKEYTPESWGTNHRTFHATALSHIDHYSRKSWDRAYTFAIVRHPLARQVSNFFFLASLCENKKKQCRSRHIPEEVMGEKMDLLTDKEKILAFHQWMGNLYEAHPPGSPDQYLIGSLGHGNEAILSFNNTQTSWLIDEKDEIVVDNIFHLEDLSKNMATLTEAIPCLGNKDENESNYYDDAKVSRTLKEEKTHVDMIHSNTTPKYPDYKKFTKNEKTQRIMKELFDVDYKNFGYEY